jgi:glutaredoxin
LVKVEIYSRNGCHLCERAEATVREVQNEINFELSIIYIDGNHALEDKYGEEVPVTLINGQRHDYFRVDRERFKSAVLRQHQ